jgi:hypothetical protein
MTTNYSESHTLSTKGIDADSFLMSLGKAINRDCFLQESLFQSFQPFKPFKSFREDLESPLTAMHAVSIVEGVPNHTNFGPGQFTTMIRRLGLLSS